MALENFELQAVAQQESGLGPQDNGIMLMITESARSRHYHKPAVNGDQRISLLSKIWQKCHYNIPIETW